MATVLRCATMAIAFLVSACASHGFTDEALAALRSDHQSLLMLKIEVTGGEKAHHVYRGFAGPLGIGTAGFETGGHMRPVANHRSFSEEAAKEGWVWLLVPIGMRYLTFSPIGYESGDLIRSYDVDYRSIPRFKLRIPDGGPSIVYAGTVKMQLHEKSRLLTNPSATTIRISDETPLAKEVLSQYLPEFAPLITILLEPHSGPVIF